MVGEWSSKISLGALKVMLEGKRQFSGILNITDLKIGKISWIIQVDLIQDMILKSRELCPAGSRRELKEKLAKF